MKNARDSYSIEKQVNQHEKVISLKTQKPEGRVSVSEFDPWRGYWTDPATERHWATVSHMAGKLEIPPSFMDHILDKDKSQIKYVADLRNRTRIAYCFEDLATDPKIIGYSVILKVEKGGDWKDFYTDEQQRHWGSVNQIQHKSKISETFIKKEIVGKLSKKIKDKNRIERDAYCYEDIVNSKNLQELNKLPKATNEGEWKGFYVDETGRHFGTLTMLSYKTELSRVFLEKVTSRMNSLDILSVNKVKVKAYSLEDIEASSEVISFKVLPKVNGKGEWEHFYIDSQGRHFSTVKTIAKKLKKDYETIKRRIENLKSIKITTQGYTLTAYSYEDLMQIMKE